MFIRTGVRLAVAVGPSGRCTVPGLHFQCVRSLLLPIEHHLREDLPGLPINLEVILSFVSVAVHHVISDLKRKPNFPPLSHCRFKQLTEFASFSIIYDTQLLPRTK